MKILCEYFRMYHYISLGKTGKIHRYHWKSGGKTVEKHTGAIFGGMWLCKIEAQGRIGPLRRKLHSFRMPDKRCLSLRVRTMKKRLRLGAAWMCLIDAL
jgi:hypothetical protein